MQPGSALVASVNSREISGQRSASCGLILNFAVMKIITTCYREPDARSDRRFPDYRVGICPVGPTFLTFPRRLGKYG